MVQVMQEEQIFPPVFLFYFCSKRFGCPFALVILSAQFTDSNTKHSGNTFIG
jgi:hypothetical protein